MMNATTAYLGPRRTALILGGMFLLNLLAASVGTETALGFFFGNDMDNWPWVGPGRAPVVLALQAVANFTATYFLAWAALLLVHARAWSAPSRRARWLLLVFWIVPCVGYFLLVSYYGFSGRAVVVDMINDFVVQPSVRNGTGRGLEIFIVWGLAFWGSLWFWFCYFLLALVLSHGAGSISWRAFAWTCVQGAWIGFLSIFCAAFALSGIVAAMNTSALWALDLARMAYLSITWLVLVFLTHWIWRRRRSRICISEEVERIFS